MLTPSRDSGIARSKTSSNAFSDFASKNKQDAKPDEVQIFASNTTFRGFRSDSSSGRRLAKLVLLRALNQVRPFTIRRQQMHFLMHPPQVTQATINNMLDRLTKIVEEACEAHTSYEPAFAELQARFDPIHPSEMPFTNIRVLCEAAWVTDFIALILVLFGQSRFNITRLTFNKLNVRQWKAATKDHAPIVDFQTKAKAMMAGCSLFQNLRICWKNSLALKSSGVKWLRTNGSWISTTSPFCTTPWTVFVCAFSGGKTTEILQVL